MDRVWITFLLAECILALIAETDFTLCNITVLGARNSFHRPNNTLQSVPYQWSEWRPRPGALLQKHSCRAFDAEISWDNGMLTIVNVPHYDWNSSCSTLMQCVSDIAHWSCVHPDHEPIFLIVKHSAGDGSISGAMNAQMWLTVWNTISQAWSCNACRSIDAPDVTRIRYVETCVAIASNYSASPLIINSHLVRGNAESVSAAVGVRGGSAWPDFQSARGKLVVAFGREAFGTGPEDAIALSSDVGAFVMDSITTWLQHSASAWTGFVRDNLEAQTMTDDTALSEHLQMATAAGLITVSMPDKYYTPLGLQTAQYMQNSLETFASIADTNGDQRVPLAEAAAFLSACGRRLQPKLVLGIMTTHCGISASLANSRGCDLKSFARLLSSETPWVAQMPPSATQAYNTVKRAVASGASIVFGEYPGSTYSRYTMGYYTAFNNDAAVACRTGSTCSFSSAQTSLASLELVNMKDD